MTSPAQPKNRIEPIQFGVCFGLAFLYVMMIPYSAAKVGDFHHLWIGGHLVATGQGHLLYDPATHYALLSEWGAGMWGARNEILGAFFYPPPSALLYASLGWMEVENAKAVMAAIDIAAAGAAAWLLSSLVHHKVRFAWIVVLIGLAPPYFYNFGLGQNGCLAMAAMTLSAWLWSRKSEFGAGLVLGILFACKPSWALAIGWVPLVFLRTRVIGGIITSAAIAAALSTAILGAHAWAQWLEIAKGLANLHRMADYPLNIQHSVLALTRQTFGLGAVADVLGWGAAATLVAATVWRIRTREATLITTVGLLFAVAVWINPHLHHYDVVVAIPAVVAVAAMAPDWRPAWRRAGWIIIAIWYLSFPIATSMGLAFPALANLGLWVVLAFAETETRSAESPAGRALGVSAATVSTLATLVGLVAGVGRRGAG